MRHTTPILAVVATLAGAAGALAQGRPFTPTLTCSAIKAIVSREQDVVLATSETAYELVHLDNMACGSGETGAPAFAPASDDARCLAGWRCVQRNNGDSSK